MFNSFTTKGRGSAPLLRAVLFGAALVLPAAGCESILDVDDKDVTSRDLLTTPEAIPTLRAGAISDFTFGYEQLIQLGGMLADEWINSETFPTRIQMDQRNILVNNSNLTALFAQAATANASPEFASQRIGEIQTAFPASTGFNDDRSEVQSLSGMAKVAIAEHFCEGVPLSRLTVSGASIEFDYGDPLTRAQMLDSAIADFDRARAVVASGTGAADVNARNLAIVGRARAMLNRAQNPAQIAAVLTFLQANPVPRTYTYQLQHSANSGGENNGVFSFNILGERISVASREGTNGLPFRDTFAGQPGGRDPRVLWIRTGPPPDVGFDNSTPQFDALKYPERPAFTVIASGVEASLMAAEAHLAAGNPQAMLDSLNALRANVQSLMQLHNFDYVNQQARVGYAAGQSASLAPLTLPATTAAQVDLLFQERGFWLAFTGHRLGDMRRLIRQYGRNSETVFPTGAYHKGGVYGTDVNFPIPVQEANNPNAPESPDAQCLNRNA
jgi:starch-binding outer membrane protein, SusD/RagB family